MILFSRVCKLIQTDQGIDRLGECIANLLVGQAQTAKIIQVTVTYTPKEAFSYFLEIKIHTKVETKYPISLISIRPWVVSPFLKKNLVHKKETLFKFFTFEIAKVYFFH